MLFTIFLLTGWMWVDLETGPGDAGDRQAEPSASEGEGSEATLKRPAGAGARSGSQAKRATGPHRQGEDLIVSRQPRPGRRCATGAGKELTEQAVNRRGSPSTGRGPLRSSDDPWAAAGRAAVPGCEQLWRPPGL